MKTNLLGGKFRNLKNGLLAVAVITFCGSLNTVQAQTINIGPNQYAFQFTGNPNFGLFFNSTNSQYEFRNGSAAPIFAIGAANGDLRSNLSFASGSDYLVGPDRYAFRYVNQPNFGLYFNDTDSRYEFLNGGANPIFGFSALNGRMTTDLEFEGSAAYKVAPNKYAIQSAANANIGLYFGASDYEFRNSSGNSVLNINANTGEIVSTSSISADGGNSAEWSEAHDWGDHAVAGYINSESDPKVGSLASNSIPVWNGSQLSNSAVTGITNGIQVEGSSGTVSINSDGFLGGTSKVGFSNLGNENGYIQMGLGVFQIMNTTDFAPIAFGNNNILHSVFDSEGRLGVNTNNPNGRLTVNGESELTEDVINANVNYSGTVDVRAIDVNSVTAPGYGYGIYSTGGYMGVRGEATSTDYTGTTYGVFGRATGTSTSGTRVGVYGEASGGNKNWAMYSSGDHLVTGRMVIGVAEADASYKLSVDGKIICEEMRVLISGNWPDYVFNEDYSLMDLNEVEEYIEKNNHLPGMPSADEIDGNQGVEVGEMQRKTIEKVEELTLYLIEANKRMDELAKQNEVLRQELNELKND